jgi:hypothetical protein
MATPTPTRPQPTGFDVAFAFLSLAVALFSLAGSFLAFFVSTGTLLGWDTTRWVELAPTFLLTAVLPFLLHKEARIWAATPLAALVALRDWERPRWISATLARLCTSAFWIVLVVAALDPEQLPTTPMLVVHGLHVLGWPFSFWMAVVKPHPTKS